MLSIIYCNTVPLVVHRIQIIDTGHGASRGPDEYFVWPSDQRSFS
jgi:hypothetical protein